jgi:molecular chaperone DnaK (HSP70)
VRLGIDFGTCFMSAAYMQGDIPTPVRFGYNTVSLPSAAYVTARGEVMIGDDAVDRRQENPGAFRQYFKRDLGGHPYVFAEGLSIPIADLVKRMFVRAREAAIAQAPALAPVDGVVVTVPVTYEAGLRELTRQAALDAGFGTVDLLDEPLAAAEHWSAVAHPGGDADRPFLVYDLGGGTFDAALVIAQAGGIRLLSQPVGQAQLGGVVIDEALLADLERARPQAFAGSGRAGQMRRRLRLAAECLAAKERLSVASETQIFLETADGEPLEPYVLDRAGLSVLAAPLIEETVDICDRLVGEADLGWEALGTILLVGGSCRMPLLQDILRRRTGLQPVLADDPALAVCFGAARHAERLAQARAAQAAAAQERYVDVGRRAGERKSMFAAFAGGRRSAGDSEKSQ